MWGKWSQLFCFPIKKKSGGASSRSRRRRKQREIVFELVLRIVAFFRFLSKNGVFLTTFNTRFLCFVENFLFTARRSLSVERVNLLYRFGALLSSRFSFNHLEKFSNFRNRLLTSFYFNTKIKNYFMEVPFFITINSETISTEVFHLVQRQMEQYYEMMITDKKKIPVWSRRLHLALKAYQVRSTIADIRFPDAEVSEYVPFLKFLPGTFVHFNCDGSKLGSRC